MRLEVGSTVCHCVHGVGQVRSVVEKQILGGVSRFSVIDFGGITVMVNVERADDVLRPPVGPREARRIMDYLERPAGPSGESSPSRLYQANLARLKSGDVYKLADVLRDLAPRHRERKLSVRDRELYERAETLLAKELAFATHEKPDRVVRKLEEAVAGSA